MRQNSSARAYVKLDLRSASILKDGRVMFNLAANKYRIVVWINYPYRSFFHRNAPKISYVAKCCFLDPIREVATITRSFKDLNVE